MLFKLFPIKYLNGIINLPGSKSISNRILLMAALSNNNEKIILKNFLFCDDTHYMIKNLKLLGIKIITNLNKKLCIIYNNYNNINLFLKKNTYLIKLYVENAGTVIRFLTSILSLYKCNIILYGNDRMKHRPIKDLVKALQARGALIYYLEKYGYPPIQIYGGFKGGDIYICGNFSSQFISSLLISVPLSKNDSNIYINKIISKPYIYLTYKLLKIFNINIKFINEYHLFIKGNQKYISPHEILIEGDATSASYFISSSIIKGKQLLINGIGNNTIQGDISFIKCLKLMGSKIIINKNFIFCYKTKYLSGIHHDMNHIPDVAMTIACISPFTNGTIMIKNIFNWRIKETDRILAITNILTNIGLKVFTNKNYIYIIPSIINKKIININSYNDHRIVMCFSLLSLLNKIKYININNYECINKTFPKYFNFLKHISYCY